MTYMRNYVNLSRWLQIAFSRYVILHEANGITIVLTSKRKRFFIYFQIMQFEI